MTVQIVIAIISMIAILARILPEVIRIPENNSGVWRILLPLMVFLFGILITTCAMPVDLVLMLFGNEEFGAIRWTADISQKYWEPYIHYWAVAGAMIAWWPSCWNTMCFSRRRGPTLL